jgi:hypothetical protein
MRIADFEWSQHASLLAICTFLFIQSVLDGRRLSKLKEKLHDLEKLQLREVGSIASAHHKISAANLRVNNMMAELHKLRPSRPQGHGSK